MNNQRLRILCADDEHAIGVTFDVYLRRMNHTVDVATDGSAAYHFSRQRRYDIIFMDKNMPVMDGLDSLKAIRERNESVYIVLMSGYADGPEVSWALENGADAFLAKPVTFSALDTHVNLVLERKAQGLNPSLYCKAGA